MLPSPAPTTPSLVEDLRANRDLVLREAEDIPYIRPFPTPATFYSFWDVRECFGKTTPEGRVIGSSDDLAAYLMSETGVITASGSAFMWDGYLRLCFATPEETITEGLAAARKALSALEP